MAEQFAVCSHSRWPCAWVLWTRRLLLYYKRKCWTLLNKPASLTLNWPSCCSLPSKTRQLVSKIGLLKNVRLTVASGLHPKEHERDLVLSPLLCLGKSFSECSAAEECVTEEPWWMRAIQTATQTEVDHRRGLERELANSICANGRIWDHFSRSSPLLGQKRPSRSRRCFVQVAEEPF